jgi:hypothetical protein
MTVPGASCRVRSVAQFDSLGMARITGMEQCLTIPPKNLRHKLQRPSTEAGALLDRK